MAGFSEADGTIPVSRVAAANVHGAALSAAGVTGRQALQSFAAAGWAVVLVGGVGLHCAGRTLLSSNQRGGGVCGGLYHAENKASALHVYVEQPGGKKGDKEPYA